MILNAEDVHTVTRTLTAAEVPETEAAAEIAEEEIPVRTPMQENAKNVNGEPGKKYPKY